MKGQHAAAAERRPWHEAALAVADWAVRAGLQFCALMIALFLITPMAVRRRIAGHPPAHAAPHR